MRAAIHELKYRGSRKARALLAGALAEYLVEFGADAYGPALLVPVPLSRSRLRERGFNQCAVVAEDALEKSGVSIRLTADVLLRVADTEHQTRLSRLDRLENVRGAFAAARACDPAAVYIVFDDVITTGATLQAAIDALSAAGARRVFPLALAA